MQTDSVTAYVQALQKLQQEKVELEARLVEINRALGGVTAAPIAPAPKAGGPAGNTLSLPQAVLKVTSAKPLTKQEILDAVKALGYRFKTKEPLKSLNPVLYGNKPKFDRKDGKFSPAAGAKAASAAAKATAPTVRRKRKKMSAEAKAKLSAKAKARWAAVRAAGKKRL